MRRSRKQTLLSAFRVNAYQQRGTIAYAFRIVPFQPHTISELNLPPIVEQIAMKPRGLVLVTGITGSRKSTALAAMLQHINQNRTANIITIEDPIEFLHRDNKAHINQREVGTDTASFAQVPRADKPGRVPAAEILVNTATVRENIRDMPKSLNIPELIAEGTVQYGMQSFDQSLMNWYKKGVISYENALYHATNPSEFALRIQGVAGRSDTTWDNISQDVTA
ncbi:MAG: ATPase, T2SS/T4P/T4SS family [Gemmatimonadales bacterium]